MHFKFIANRDAFFCRHGLQELLLKKKKRFKNGKNSIFIINERQFQVPTMSIMLPFNV